jgi:hypothetical protein
MRVCASKTELTCSTVSGMHVVCVYTIHQNAKLLISGAKLYDLTEEQVKTYDD